MVQTKLKGNSIESTATGSSKIRTFQYLQYFDLFAFYSGSPDDRGARSLFARYGDDGAWIDVDDPGVLLDVDTRSDLSALQDRAALA